MTRSGRNRSAGARRWPTAGPASRASNRRRSGSGLTWGLATPSEPLPSTPSTRMRSRRGARCGTGAGSPTSRPTRRAGRHCCWPPRPTSSRPRPSIGCRPARSPPCHTCTTSCPAARPTTSTSPRSGHSTPTSSCPTPTWCLGGSSTRRTTWRSSIGRSSTAHRWDGASRRTPGPRAVSCSCCPGRSPERGTWRGRGAWPIRWSRWCHPKRAPRSASTTTCWSPPCWHKPPRAHPALADSARHLARRSEGDATTDPTRENAYVGAFVYTTLGDTNDALRLLKAYIAANPERAGHAPRRSRLVVQAAAAESGIRGTRLPSALRPRRCSDAIARGGQS